MTELDLGYLRHRLDAEMQTFGGAGDFMTDDSNWVGQILSSPRLAALDPAEQILTHLRGLLAGLASDRPLTPNELAAEARALLAGSCPGTGGKGS